MTVRSSSFLHTRRSGPEDGPPWLLLHDRHGKLEDSEALAPLAGDSARAIAVRGVRTQTVGGYGEVHSYYWFFGPLLTPELAALGDVLFQLEKLVLETAEASPTGKVGLIGKGEGGIMALLIALLWPEKLSRVIALEAGLPENLADIPIETRDLGGLDITLRAPIPRTQAATRRHLEALGATLSIEHA